MKLSNEMEKEILCIFEGLSQEMLDSWNEMLGVVQHNIMTRVVDPLASDAHNQGANVIEEGIANAMTKVMSGLLEDSHRQKTRRDKKRNNDKGNQMEDSVWV